MRQVLVSGLLALSMLGADPAAATSAQDYLRNAQKHLDEGEANAAVIELKNALSIDPTLVEARLMLGKVYLRLGDGPSAEKEIKRAEGLGVAREHWISALAEAYLLQGKFQNMIDEIQVENKLDPELRASLLAHRGLAQLGLAQLDEAGESFDAALELNPSLESALVGRIQLAIGRNERERAIRFADELLEKSPDSVKALWLRAELDRQAGRNSEAIVFFDRLLKEKPGHPQARLGRAASFVALGQPDAVQTRMRCS